MAASSKSPVVSPVAQNVRRAFVVEVSAALDALAADVTVRLTELIDAPAPNAAESQQRRDQWMKFRTARPLWVNATRQAWEKAVEPPPEKAKEDVIDISGLQLVGTDEVEHKIQASRLVQAVSDRVNAELDDLRVRVRLLEQSDDFASWDPLRPEVLVQHLVSQWSESGMAAQTWALVGDSLQKRLIDTLRDAYRHANESLIRQDVLPVITLKDRVKAPKVRDATPASAARKSGAAVAPPARSDDLAAQVTRVAPMDVGQSPIGDRANAGPGETGPRTASSFFGGRLGWGRGQDSAAQPVAASGLSVATDTQMPATSQGAGLPGEDTPMATAASPIAQAQARAQGLVGQIRRIFVSKVGRDVGDVAQHQAPSAALARAMAEQAAAAAGPGNGARVADGATDDHAHTLVDTMVHDYSPASVAQVAGNLRQRTSELKNKAETKSEKAIIEIVALMFQAILAEERIPPNIRVWFARLQMPVLRLALEDAEFFSTADHPARLLIDRMGSCVMGFDVSASSVQSSAMEVEVKRIVQVVEQYPETGRKVYQIVYAEFQKFLAKFLTEKEHTQKVVSVAQQVEQKETLAIQYTIEMRNLLKDMPVRDAIRDFLFKVWSEVLAVSALRYGAKHADTLVLKKVATDLLWAASAKPGREERARVIHDLPHLLSRLRSGMTLLGLPTPDQEKHIKDISDTLADAFLSKTHAISQQTIDAMAQRLAELEDFVSEDGLGDLPLDAESLEMMLGLEPGTIDVVANGGTKPTAAMLAWAQELQIGSWFTLDHNAQVTQVQFVWRSDHKQLNLFAATTGRTFLIQSGRLAAYLQAGLLVPREEEALTVRATRDAIAKLEANPERLLT